MIRLSSYRLLMGLFLFLTVIPAMGQELDLTLLKSMQARSIGPAGMSGRVTTIDVVRDQPSVIYVGTASGGLWKSESGGIDWKPLFDEERVHSIGALAIAPSNASIIWAGTGEGNPRNSQSSGAGIYRSLDAGETWELMGLEKTRNIHRVIIHPTDPQTVWVGVQGSAWGEHPERGVYKTTDGGKTWHHILKVDEKTGIGDLVLDPSNPNKLFAAMWEFRRWPWFFKSGGPGSGLYVTHDGGDNWKELTSEEGLPKGELGRMGLAIAPSNPKIVYAIIESKKNALFGSKDGGISWQKINDKPEIGNRPFYYFDIFVDPVNENRIYSLYSMVSLSEDGGKSFRVMIPYSGVHPDHHAWYIHPDRPHYIIDGNDGGLNISHDRGATWRFVENLPLAQFYHINIDNDIPYNVYGGMQDNGSWRGPAYVWRSNGIRNSYWEELMFGDGFDVVPDPENNRYGYAMSQGGSLGRYDYETGAQKNIRPRHPDGLDLRFNWNAAIAPDPFDTQTIYYGSQFVHKSTDRGENWTIISPDLTTNDPEKQKQNESGGLTYDVTQAENFTTLVTIAPSPVQEGVIWAGSDDGRLHLTEDGGANWKSLEGKLKDMPAGSWIPQIHVSNHEAGEAFVVVNNYRRNDWTPMVYHTSNFGRSFARIVDENKVWGYALSIVQDPVAPNLLFLGTEFGLYVSLNKGETWQQWKNGYPTAATIDLKIHPREHDLVIGTFGRAAFVLDDIRPLRTLALEGAEVLAQTVKLYPVPDAYLAYNQQASGARFGADAMFEGENRDRGARISYSVNPDAALDTAAHDSALVTIHNAEGEQIRMLRFKPEKGLNRVVWRLDRKGAPRMQRSSASDRSGRGEPGGPRILPATYKVKIAYKGGVDSTVVSVHFDPRVAYDESEMRKFIPLQEEQMAMQEEAAGMLKKIKNAGKAIDLIMKQLPKEGDEAEQALRDQSQAMQDSLKSLEALFFEPQGEKQGITRDPTVLAAKISLARGAVYSPDPDGPNQTTMRYLEEAKRRFDEVKEQVDAFFAGDWMTYKEAVGQVKLSPFKD
jgi:photosystem II stability/assembly factor-like uncharacterized protein